MQFDNQKTRNVADVVAKILAGESAKQEPKMLEEGLKGNQHKIDANKNNKIDAHDFKLLRAKKEVKKEEVEQIDELSNETLKSYLKKTKEVESGGGGRQGSGSSYENQSIGKRDAVRRLEARSGKIGKYGVVPKVPGYNKEEVNLQEKSDDYEVKQSKTDPDVHHVHYKGKKIGYVYGNKKDMWGHEYHAMGTGDDGHSSKSEAVSALKADHKHHISGAYKNEEVEQKEENSMTFSEMLAAYKEHGLAVIAEEPTEEEFNKEIKKAQAKSEGKEKADVAKASVQAVKQEETHTKVQVIDMTDPYNIQKKEIDLEERTLTEPEAKKKEEIVKSMKKKMSGFKERYGDRAKEVMYATATKMAKKD